MKTFIQSLKIMCTSYRSGNFLVDELKLDALLLQNKIANVIQDEFSKPINRLVNEKARLCCDACRIDDPK